MEPLITSGLNLFLLLVIVLNWGVMADTWRLRKRFVEALKAVEEAHQELLRLIETARQSSQP